jgi:hypothetical protein
MPTIVKVDENAGVWTPTRSFPSHVVGDVESSVPVCVRS